ncbi:MAG: hypothetical protein HYV34_01165 [Candidatus Kerfeldbacteria bacterium]|nr:hypothetical protein [Candidatus Kerfeldbacteria bacterium]
MDISIDLTWLLVGGQIPNPFQLFWVLFLHGGWIFLSGLTVVGIFLGWHQGRVNRHRSEIEYIYLAVDVPKDNEQSLKAIEQIFAQLAGIEESLNFRKKWIEAKVHETFSLELISIEGFVQYIIRTAKEYRDVVESAIYSQYPDAEITQVEDYAKEFHHLTFPSEDYDLWGTEFTFIKSDAYPIRTYEHFEQAISEKKFADPMAALLESMGHLGPGEQFWLQLVLTPIEQEWQEKSHHKVKELIGADVHKEDRMGKYVFKSLEFMGDQLFMPTEAAGGKHEEKGPPSQMQYLTEGQKTTVLAIEEKAGKIGYKVKFRIVYLAKKEVFHKGRGVAPMGGAILQFNDMNLNGFKPRKKTKTSGGQIFQKRRLAWRQRKILHHYIDRIDHAEGGHGIVLNIEELASLYHFPLIDVKAPLVKKVEAKKGEPPATLPTELGQPVPHSRRSAVKTASPAEEAPPTLPTEEASGPPANLPVA